MSQLHPTSGVLDIYVRKYILYLWILPKHTTPTAPGLAGFLHQEAAAIALHQGFEKGVGVEPWPVVVLRSSDLRNGVVFFFNWA